MQGLIPGRIVHYADDRQGPMAHQAAIVIRVNGGQGHANLEAFAPGGGMMKVDSVPPDVGNGKLDGSGIATMGTWHWPGPECLELCR